MEVGSIIVRSSFSSAGEESRGQHKWAWQGCGDGRLPLPPVGERGREQRSQSFSQWLTHCEDRTHMG